MNVENLDARFRPDASVVYRYLRDAGPASVVNIAEAVFPLTFGKDDPLYHRLVRGSVRRVLDSLVWMRHAGVVITAVPAQGPGDATTFHLGEVEIDPLSVYRSQNVVRDFVSEGVAVTDKVSQPAVREESDVMGVWHGEG